MRAALLLGLALLLGCSAPEVRAQGTPVQAVEVRVWQDVDDERSLYVSGRRSGGSWLALGTIRLPLDDGFTFSGRYRHGDFAVGTGALAVNVRVSQAVEDSRTILIGAREAGGSWLRLGTIDLPLDDGLSSTGRFRFGDIIIEVPRASGALIEGCSNGIAVPEPPSNPGLVRDCVTLLEARDVLLGDGEAPDLNWAVDTAMTSWLGVTVGGSAPRVTAIQVTKTFHGRVPPGLARLDQLEVLDLHDNALSGHLPREMGLLVELRELKLWPGYDYRDVAGLTGTIPPELAQLSNLQELWLSSNDLEGEIPEELAALPSLSRVYLSSNRLTGAIPPAFGRPGLRSLSLGGNRLTGEIPPELGQSVDLVRLGLSGNDLGGAIPPELGGLSSLEFLRLGQNQLTGMIPPDLGELPRVRELYLASNRLTGEIPSNLGDPPNLRFVQLYSNRFTGCTPVTLRDKIEIIPLPWCDAVQVLAPVPPLDPVLIASCASEGAVADPDRNPDLVNDCAALLQARDALDGGAGVLNWSAGTPLSEWDGLDVRSAEDRVLRLVPVERGLTGQMPAVLANLTQLESLNLRGNQLTGTIPPQLGHLEELETLDLAHNRLDGTIPPELGALASLRSLWLSGNDLSGPIPSTLWQLEDVSYVGLADNRLTGGIPSMLARLDGVYLDLSGNQLTGTIPREFAEILGLASLSLWLGGNQLEGCVPVELADAIRDRKELELPHCECPLTSRPNRGSSWSLGYGSDDIARMPSGSMRDPGTYRISLQLVLDIPEGGQYHLSERYRDDDGRILVRLDEERSVSHLVLDPFTGEEVDRLVIEGPPACGSAVANLLDTVSESVRVQPIENPLLGSGYPVLHLFEPVEGPGTYHIPAKYGSLILDVPAGVRLTVEEVEYYCTTSGGCHGVLRVRDEDSGSFVAFGGRTGEEVSREIAAGGDERALGELLDSVLASLRVLIPPHRWPSCDAEPSAPDCATLLAVVGELAVDAELNWSQDLALSYWDGVGVDEWSGRVNWLNLTRRGLGGVIPARLAQLTELRWLDLLDNALTGSIPPELGRLSRLRSLRLARNELTGSIPPELGRLSNLHSLSLDRNELAGAIPPELGRLSRLLSLSLWQNELTGNIPPELGRLSRLRSFRLWQNELTGSIPPELGSLEEIRFLDFGDNSLTGEIPPELAGLPYLESLWVLGNQLEGCIPAGLERLQLLRHSGPDSNPLLRDCSDDE